MRILREPQLANSYSYAGNNPITQKDPDGRIAPFLGVIFAVIEYYSYANAAVDVYNYTNVLRYPEGYSSADIDDAGNRMFKDILSAGIGRLSGDIVSAGMNTVDAVRDTTIYVTGKVQGVVNTIRNSSGQGNSLKNQTTPALPAIVSPTYTSTQTTISAPSGSRSSSNSSSGYNTATNYLSSAQKALNRGDTKTAQTYINKAKKIITGK